MKNQQEIKPTAETLEIHKQLRVMIKYFDFNIKSRCFELIDHQFKSKEDFEEFRTAIILLKGLRIIKPISGTEIPIYVFSNGKNEIQYKEAKQFEVPKSGVDQVIVFGIVELSQRGQ